MEAQKSALEAALERQRAGEQQMAEEFKERESALLHCLEHTTRAHADAMLNLRAAGMPVPPGTPSLPLGDVSFMDAQPLSPHAHGARTLFTSHVPAEAAAVLAAPANGAECSGHGSDVSASSGSAMARSEAGPGPRSIAVDCHWVGDLYSSSLGSEGGMSAASSSTHGAPPAPATSAATPCNGLSPAAAKAGVATSLAAAQPSELPVQQQLPTASEMTGGSQLGSGMGGRKGAGSYGTRMCPPMQQRTRDSVSEVECQQGDGFAALLKGGKAAAGAAVGRGNGGAEHHALGLRVTTEQVEEAL